MAQVMREDRTVDFATSDRPDVAQVGGALVGVDTAKHRGSIKGPAGTNTNIVDNSVQDSLVNALAQVGHAWGKQKLSNEREEAYLAGQAAASIGQSAAEVESNIFTRDWAGAGWSDTKSRLGVADANAQTAVDMKKLREQPPEKMKEYLQTRRKQLMPMMEGMSLDARKGMMAQMALSDQHAISTHMGEHQKFIVDQQSKAVQTSFSVARDAMSAARTDPVAYGKATDNAMGNIWGNIVSNPNLPQDMKATLIEQAASLALEDNHEQLYEKMRDMKSNGMSLLDNLPFESQSKLAKAWQASRKDTATMRNTAYNTQLGLYQAKLDDPLAPATSWDDHQAVVQQGIQFGIITGEKQASLAKQWADANARKATGINAAAMYAAGDVGGMFRLGVTEEEGAKHWLTAQQRKGQTPAQAATALAQIGASTGQLSSFKAVGDLMRSSVQMIGLTDNMDPGQLAGVNAVLGTIEGAEKRGSLAAKSAFLGAFDDATQARLLTYWDGVKQGKSPAVAAAEAATRATENSTLSKADRAALGEQHAKDNAKLVAEIEPKGLFDQAFEKVVPNFLRSDSAVAIDKLSASRSWFEDAGRVEEAQARGKVALLQELNDVSRAHPYMGADSRRSMALAKVGARTLSTDGGPVIMPQGQTVQSFFGVPQSVGPELVERTLNSLHAPGKGNRTIYTVTADGQLQWQEKNKRGELVSPGGVINPRDIAGAVQVEQDKATEKFIATDGAGTQVKGPDGSSMHYNGNNTLGIGTNVMHQYRADLVKFESVRNKPYDDSSGKIVNGKRVQTVGVGVSSHNPFFPPVEKDGTVSEANISRSFMLASDAAMKSANESLQDIPAIRRNVYATRLLGQLAYQGGSVPKSFIEAVNTGKREDAEKALHASPQYKMSHPARKQFYDTMFNGVIPFNETK